jgi:hypothetical protein
VASPLFAVLLEPPLPGSPGGGEVLLLEVGQIGAVAQRRGRSFVEGDDLRPGADGRVSHTEALFPHPVGAK